MPDYTAIRALAARARHQIREVGPAEVRQLLEQGALLVDVRDSDELLRNPPLAGALHLSRGRLEFLISDATETLDDVIIVYCAGGNRGALAAASLQSIGYRQVYNLRDGLHGWRDAAGQAWISTSWLKDDPQRLRIN